MSTYFQQALPRIVIHRTQVEEKRNGSCQYGSAPRRRAACIKRRFRPGVTKTVSHPRCSGQDQTRKTPVTECFVCCVFVLFSTAKSMLRMGSCVRFCFHNIFSALEFRCCRVIPLRNQKLTSGERISCITRHDDFSPKSHRVVSLQVAPFLRDCNLRRAGQTENE